MTWLILSLLVISMIGPIYALLMGTIIRKHSPSPYKDDSEPKLVIALVPCLNEGLVVAKTVEKLLQLDPNMAVVVVDDGSDDGTPEILDRVDSPRFHVVSRVAPNCRQGKGEALNYALQKVEQMVADLNFDPDNAIIAVFDADGEADAHTISKIEPWFSNTEVGGVQVGVRINNRTTSILARMQDIEFTAYTEIFQYARNALTSTGLGGNGQFVRLSALQSLGPKPWSDCLTEDLDLGIRLRLGGWRTVFDGSVSVHQQGLHSPSRLLRQRTRWFQGHLQIWHLLPRIWKSNIPTAAKVDISGHLVLPVVMLMVSIGVVTSVFRLIRLVASSSLSDTFQMFLNGPFVPWWYLLGFATTPLVAAAYWRAEPDVGFGKGLAFAHLYTLYSWVWFFAGWKAIWREITTLEDWAKTERVVNDDGPATEVPSVSGPTSSPGLKPFTSDQAGHSPTPVVAKKGRKS